MGLWEIPVLTYSFRQERDEKMNHGEHFVIGSKNADASGVSPRHSGAPVARVLYYLNRDSGYYRGIACAPAPDGGRAGLRGDS
jgi:hypothetical protein